MSDRPNILIFMTDQQRGDLSALLLDRHHGGFEDARRRPGGIGNLGHGLAQVGTRRSLFGERADPRPHAVVLVGS